VYLNLQDENGALKVDVEEVSCAELTLVAPKKGDVIRVFTGSKKGKQGIVQVSLFICKSSRDLESVE